MEGSEMRRWEGGVLWECCFVEEVRREGGFEAIKLECFHVGRLFIAFVKVKALRILQINCEIFILKTAVFLSLLFIDAVLCVVLVVLSCAAELIVVVLLLNVVMLHVVEGTLL